ncbi:MAG: Rrf2 family transcriptional regulator [Saprospiraceae bacterium]|uniref:Rrf2 family transcriptional regulator n=1 Tax=Candidatus Opimibacter skivensis TaxID=2982028 RepID=A0A9D7SZQ6_9BACT|nr:Rrf2 family transcriptional regulator [Candidatus Opimibacter skivensis]
MLTQKGKYAIKALIYMAEEKRLGQDTGRSRWRARSLKILETILLELKRHGFVESQQGATGGYSLSNHHATLILLNSTGYLKAYCFNLLRS